MTMWFLGIGFLVMSVASFGTAITTLKSGVVNRPFVPLYRDTETTEFWCIVVFGFIFATATGAFGAAMLLGWVLR